MEPGARKRVVARAGDRCEFCRSAQIHVPYLRFWLEHVIPRQHGGSDGLENLALSCPWCNRRKGTNLSAIDPETRQVVLLFNPRTQSWGDHFRFDGLVIVGLTATGRATAELLALNDERRLHIRALAESGSPPLN